MLGGDLSSNTSGSINQNRLLPATYEANFSSEDDVDDARMTFRDGTVNDYKTKPAIPPAPDYVPITAADLRGATDPLTAGLLLAPAALPAATNPAGLWEGTLAPPNGDIGFAFNIHRDGDKWAVELDVPMQGLSGLPLSNVKVDGAAVGCAMPGAGDPHYGGKLSEDGKTITGTFNVAGQQIPLSELANIHEASGASFIYRESNSRYIGVQYSIEGRDLQSAVQDGQRAIADVASSLPPGYTLAWGGEYSEFLEAEHQMAIIGPLALLLIFMILFALYGNFKFPVSIALGVLMTEPVGALIALKLTHTPFSVSSVLGLLALLGVSVETAVILVSFINKLRLEGRDIRTATREASLLRLRPIMMTALVACLGLLPAALSTGIGSDTQKPFAIVIVAGLLSRLLLGFFVNPVLYEMVAREGDVLQV